MDVMDSTWHHVCVSWDGKVGLLAVFKDGHRNFKLNEFMASLLQKPNEGRKKRHKLFWGWERGGGQGVRDLCCNLFLSCTWM